MTFRSLFQALPLCDCVNKDQHWSFRAEATRLATWIQCSGQGAASPATSPFHGSSCHEVQIQLCALSGQSCTDLLLSLCRAGAQPGRGHLSTATAAAPHQEANSHLGKITDGLAWLAFVPSKGLEPWRGRMLDHCLQGARMPLQRQCMHARPETGLQLCSGMWRPRRAVSTSLAAQSWSSCSVSSSRGTHLHRWFRVTNHFLSPWHLSQEMLPQLPFQLLLPHSYLLSATWLQQSSHLCVELLKMASMLPAAEAHSASSLWVLVTLLGPSPSSSPPLLCCSSPFPSLSSLTAFAQSLPCPVYPANQRCSFLLPLSSRRPSRVQAGATERQGPTRWSSLVSRQA